MIVGAVLRRDLRAALGGPLFWTLAAAWLIVQGLLFSVLLGGYLRASASDAFAESVAPLLPGLVDPLYGATALFVVLITPALAMRSLAGEAQAGTLPLLLSAPGPLLGVVVGKWLAIWVQLAVLVALAATVPAVVLFGAGDAPLAPALSALLGLLLLSACAAAVGVAASAGAGSQLLAAALATCALLGSWMLVVLEAQDGPLVLLARHGSLLVRVRGFGAGLIERADLVWLAAATGLALAVAWQRLHARRWR